jgi:hypothetical protein
MCFLRRPIHSSEAVSWWRRAKPGTPPDDSKKVTSSGCGPGGRRGTYRHVSRPRRRARRGRRGPAGPGVRSGESSQPSGRSDLLGGAGPPPLALGVGARPGRIRVELPSSRSSAASESTRASWLRIVGPGGEALEIPRDVLADVAAAAALVAVELHEVCRVPAHRVGHLPRVGVIRCADPSKAASRSANSHGRPRHPRPTTTPSAPVSATIRSASSADQISPLPSTGMVVTACLRAVIAGHTAYPE